MIVMGAAYVAGSVGVAFVGELAVVALMVTGFMMTRGSFGDNGAIGSTMLFVAPAAWILPFFFAALFLATPVFGALVIVAGIAKLPGMW